MKAFFTITSWMLLLFSAGMMTYGVHEIEEYVVDA
jgi:high-affinity Fe2+/Pb2+ permease